MFPPKKPNLRGYDKPFSISNIICYRESISLAIAQDVLIPPTWAPLGTHCSVVPIAVEPFPLERTTATSLAKNAVEA